MKYGRFTIFPLFTSILFFSTNIFAAQLTIPENYQLIKVNGAAGKSNFFSSESIVELKTGHNILILQYSELFEDVDNDDHVTIKSEPQVVLFTVESNTITEKYFVVMPTFLDDTQAREFADQPFIEINFIDKHSGQQKSLKVLSKSLTEFEAGLAFQQIDKLKLQQLETSKDSEIQPAEPLSNEALVQLKRWWSKANEKQKQRFIEYTQQK